MTLGTYYRPPANADPVTVRTDRARRKPRYHLGARVADGPLLLPEACNLDQAGGLTPDIPHAELALADRSQFCRRCFLVS